MNISDIINNPQKIDEILNVAINRKKIEIVNSLIGFAKNPYLVYSYARYIVGGKVSDELEDIIVKSKIWSLNYAKDVLKRPFPKGEEIFSKDGQYSAEYAIYALKKPFPKGEKAIAQNGYWSYLYAEKVLKAPFIPGEKAIIEQDWIRGYVSFLARRKGRLEEFIQRHPEIENETYILYLFKRFSEKGTLDKNLEKMISKSGLWSNFYAQNILKAPFPKGEKAIIKMGWIKEYTSFLKSINQLDEFYKRHPEVKPI